MSRARKALGRGLEALLPDHPTAGEAGSVTGISIERIDPNPFQPRRNWKREELESLARSIRSQGVLQPLVLRRHGTRYQLIAGERRLRAARMAGLDRVPAIVREADDGQMLALALLENIQREDLGPMEKAEAFMRLSSEFGLTQEEMGEMVGLDRSSVANFQRLLELPGPVQEMLREGALSMGHGRALLALPDEKSTLRAARKAVRQELSVRKLEDLVRQTLGGKKRRRKAPGELSPELRKLQDRLQRHLKAKVSIRHAGGSGNIEIRYDSLGELDRILELLTK